LFEDRAKEALLFPLGAARANGFGDAVGVDGESVAEIEGEGLLFIGGVGKQAKDRTAAFEPGDLAVVEEQGRVVAGVDVGEGLRGGIVDEEDECSVAAGGGGFIEEPVEVFDDGGDTIFVVMEHEAAKRGSQGSHEQGGGNTFAADVGDDTAEEAFAGDEEVVVVAADLIGALVGSCGVDAGDSGKGLGQEPLLDLTGEIEFAGGFGASDGLFAEGFDVAGSLEAAAHLLAELAEEAKFVGEEVFAFGFGECCKAA